MADQMFDTELLDESIAKRESAFPKFYMRDVVDKKATLEAGETIWTSHEYVTIMLAGDSKLIIDRKAHPGDKKRFARAYAAFKQGEEQKPDGFPLAAWVGMPSGYAKNLAERHCYTVEQLVSMPDTNLPPLPDIYKVVERAREFLDSKTDSAQFSKLQTQAEEQQKELEAKDETIGTLQESMKAMQIRLQALEGIQSPVVTETETPRRRGKVKD